jgi:hypothetical protein
LKEKNGGKGEKKSFADLKINSFLCAAVLNR